MTFSDLKQALLNNAKQLEICDLYHDIQAASNEVDIITATIGAKLVPWALQSQVADASLLSEFTPSNLTDNGIYVSGSPVITNPSQNEIYISGSTVAEVNFSDSNKWTIYCLGNSGCTVNLSGLAFATVKCKDSSSLIVNAGDTSACCIHHDTSGTSTVNLNDDTTGHLFAASNGSTTVVALNNSFCKIIGKQNSTVVYSIGDDAVITTKAFDSSSITTAPL